MVEAAFNAKLVHNADNNISLLIGTYDEANIGSSSSLPPTSRLVASIRDSFYDTSHSPSLS